MTIRRHRHSPEVAEEVGADWAERLDPENRLVPASAEEEAVIDELVGTWLRPVVKPPVRDKLFAWTLAKAFLSSPAALAETIRGRLQRIDDPVQQAALKELDRRNEACLHSSGKYDALVDHLRAVGVAQTSDERAVIFSERVPTLGWLRERLLEDLTLRPDQVEVLHGGLPDDQQQAIVESFKQASSPIRLLITGDVASEGVNLHRQCHRLIHYDIPWSLIRIEQRNGRIDRYGQRHRPEIVTLLLDSRNDAFAGDVRVLTKLVEREHEAHQALGDAASLMGQHSVKAEEDAIRDVLARGKEFDEVVATPEEFLAGAEDWTVAFLADCENEQTEVLAEPSATMYPRSVDFLRDALAEYYPNPEEQPQGRDEGGVGWREHPQLVEFIPPADLRQRLEVLPQGYLKDRQVTERLLLVTDRHRADQILAEALQDATGSSWPEAHYLGPLHPVLSWAADRALSRLGRGEVFAVRGDVQVPTVLLNGTLLNRAGQVLTSAWMAAQFVAPGQQPIITPAASVAELLASVGVTEPRPNPGPPKLPDFPLIRPAVDAAEAHLTMAVGAASDDANRRVATWVERATRWDHEADALIQRSEVRHRRDLVEQARRFSAQLTPDRQRVAPLLVVLPADTEVNA
ncbi:MAG: helicase-related protein [Propionibacteriaceae bacterium]|nr:helicase-related protein [Propionibacteriaceae bacterium]